MDRATADRAIVEAGFVTQSFVHHHKDDPRGKEYGRFVATFDHVMGVIQVEHHGEKTYIMFFLTIEDFTGWASACT